MLKQPSKEILKMFLLTLNLESILEQEQFITSQKGMIHYIFAEHESDAGNYYNENTKNLLL